MPKIRVNKALKEFNISMSRLVDFLQEKGVGVENNPNAQLDESAYDALKSEFAKDSEQKKASHEVVMTKVPDEKLEIEPSKPEVIKAKASIKPEIEISGKIDLEPKKPEVQEPQQPEPKVVPVEKPAPEKQEFKVLDKIDLSQIEGHKPAPAKKETTAPSPAPEGKHPKQRRKHLPLHKLLSQQITSRKKLKLFTRN